jgi:hypothetical protein
MILLEFFLGPASELLALLAIFGIPVDIDDEHSGGHYEKKSDAWT